MMRGYHIGHFTRGAAGEKPRQPIKVILSRLAAYALKSRGALAIAALGVVMASLLNLVVPQLTRISIDQVIPSGDISRIFFVAAAIIVTAIAIGATSFVRSYFMSIVGQRTIYELRNCLYRHLQTLSLGFFAQRRTGELMSRVTNDVNAVQQLITSGVMEIATDAMTFMVIMVILFFTDWRLMLFLLATFPVTIMVTMKFGAAIRNAYREVQKHIAHVNEHLQETIANIHVVKSFGNEEYEIDRFDQRNMLNMQASINAVRLWSVYFPLIEIMNYVGLVIILSFGVMRVMGGELSLGTLVAFMAYYQLLQQPIRRFSHVMNVVQQASAAAERIFEIMDTAPDIMDRPDAIPLASCRGGLHIEKVTFSYPGSRDPVLCDVSLEVEPNRTVALVGPSGAGKSTMVNLLMRFYDPQEGRILLDGRDLRGLTIDSVRKQFGVVSQEILLLNGTVTENIAYGRPGAAPDEITAAAHEANAHDFITEFPEGYNTQVGERGVKLSGGQRQRIAIARALLKNPAILVFDEATSHLDSEAEQRIQQAMERLRKNRTCIVIAHRLSTVQCADLMVVLDKGRIVECGRPGQLLADGGRYATMFNLQFGAAQTAPGQDD